MLILSEESGFVYKMETLVMFLTLTKLAQLHLSSSAVRVSVEYMFSSAGFVANDKPNGRIYRPIVDYDNNYK